MRPVALRACRCFPSAFSGVFAVSAVCVFAAACGGCRVCPLCCVCSGLSSLVVRAVPRRAFSSGRFSSGGSVWVSSVSLCRRAGLRFSLLPFALPSPSVLRAGFAAGVLPLPVSPRSPSSVGFVPVGLLPSGVFRLSWLRWLAFRFRVVCLWRSLRRLRGSSR